MLNEETSAIVETGKVPGARYGLVAVPDTGLVGMIAAGHIVRSKKMKEVGYVRSAILPPSSSFMMENRNRRSGSTAMRKS